jgi:uncharacterized protein (TIRG00374 family)
LFAWLAFRGLDVEIVRHQAGNIRLLPVLVCLATQVLCQLLRLLRWGLMLRRLGDISWRRVFAIGSVGTPAVSLLPARIGELVRPVLVAEESQIDFGRASATVVTERLVDGGLMSLVFLGLLSLQGKEHASAGLLVSGLAFSTLFLLAGIALWLGFRYRENVLRLIGSLTRVTPGVARLASRVFAGFAAALQPIVSRRVFVPYLGLSLLLWATEAISIYSLFGVTGQSFPLSASIVVLIAIVVGTLIPSGPAHFGIFEYSVVVGLSFFDPPIGAAAFFGALLHLLQIVVLLVFAWLGLWLGNIRFERLLSLGRRQAGSRSAT